MEIKLGEIIRAKREANNYSLAEFAAKVDISTAYLSQLENGHKKNPRLEIILDIIDELNIGINELMGKDNMGEDIALKIPYMIKLLFAKDRNLKVFEDDEVQKKICSILSILLESKYFIEDKQLYSLFLEDVLIQTDNSMKRYMGVQTLNQITDTKK